uniref:(northern house mosquito) hypothetical protein n=1 Tax=Culex pipiens TaxID=7175 RepID=A0A8D8PCK6_CULPI
MELVGWKRTVMTTTTTIRIRGRPTRPRMGWMIPTRIDCLTIILRPGSSSRPRRRFTTRNCRRNMPILASWNGLRAWITWNRAKSIDFRCAATTRLCSRVRWFQ